MSIFALLKSINGMKPRVRLIFGMITAWSAVRAVSPARCIILNGQILQVARALYIKIVENVYVLYDMLSGTQQDLLKHYYI